MSDQNGKTLWIALVLAVLLALGLVGYWWSTQGGDAEQETVVIGSLLALTGPDKSFGITQQQGMLLALEDIANAGGLEGRTLEVEFADTQLNEDLGLQEYKRLAARADINAIVGVTGSGVALRIAPFANQDQTVLLSPLGTSPSLTDAGPYLFRNIASDAYSGVVLANWVIEQGRTNAALIYNSENAWSRGCRSSVEAAYPAAGGTLVVEPAAALDSMENFEPIVIAFREAPTPPEAIFVCLMGRQAGLFVGQARANELKGPFFGTDTMSQQEFVDNAREGLEHSYFVLPAESGGDRYTAFASRYQEQYSARADSIAAKAYDAVQMIAEALRELIRAERPLTGPSIRDQLSRTRYDGITGPNAFDAKGDLAEAAFERFTYRGGQRANAE